MHDTATPLLEQTSLREETVVTLPATAGKPSSKAAFAQGKAQPDGVMQFLKRFFAWIFMGKRLHANEQIIVVAAPTTQPTAPIAFKGDTASTLVTPISAYAGKPVEHAIRRRAEQQFKDMDLTKVTMN